VVSLLEQQSHDSCGYQNCSHYRCTRARSSSHNPLQPRNSARCICCRKHCCEFRLSGRSVCYRRRKKRFSCECHPPSS
jgi:hypothetical protein